MPRRIEVELTSRRDDGSWTWRAAGAREPRGVLDGGLLHQHAEVGDVVRAEADVDIDGITVVSVLPPKEARREPERLELRAPPVAEDSLVTSTLTSRGRTDRRDRTERRDRDRDRDRPARRERDRADGAGRESRPPREDGGPGPRRPGRERPSQSDRPGDAAPDAAPADRPARSERPARSDRRPRGDRPARAERPPEDGRPKPKRLRPARVHRKAVLEELPPEQRPIAEHVLLGGIPAVRQAVERQNEELRTEGKPEVKAEPLVALAEQLLPKLRTAEWRDRADAALAVIEELDLRDLRSVVVAADAAARDDETRVLAAQLRDALARRVEAEHAAWLAELGSALDDGRVVRALRLSSRPPKAGSLLPHDLTDRLGSAAGAALTADASAERWATVLDAVAFSPVRRAVAPASVPEPPSEALLAAVRKLAARLPEIAARFGIEAEAGTARPPRPPRRPPPPPPAERSEPTSETRSDSDPGAPVPS